MKEFYKYSEISEVWLEYKNAVRFYIQKKVKNEQIANDLSHEVLLKIYNSCCSTTKIRNMRSWIFQIAHNTTVDYYRSQSKFTSSIPEMENPELDSSFSGAEEIVTSLMKLLPSKYSIPLAMSDIEGLQQKEVAQKLNLSLTATKSRIQRARKLLKEIIIDCSSQEMDESGNILSLKLKSVCNPAKTNLK